MIDVSTDFGKHVRRRLRDERIIWLTTIDSSSTPQVRPVWFLWDGASFLVYSRPSTHKLRHIARNPNVSLHFDGDGRGGDIVVFTGRATPAPDAVPADQSAEYVEKYRQGFKRIGMSPEQFAAAFSVALRIIPLKLRGGK